MSGLIQGSAFRHYLFEHPLSYVECEQKLDVLRRLLRRQADGTIAALTETRIEQSFNEQLFAQFFDYRTLLQHGAGDYHLYPHRRHESDRRDDFCLGFYSPRGDLPLASCELKNPGTDLDAPQSSKYGYVSPVEQGFRAIDGSSSIQWVLVSNFDELRLYRASNRFDHETVVLSEIMTHADVRRAYALFGLPHLLGGAGQPSPLLRLMNGGPPVLLPPKPPYVRIVHEARAPTPVADASLHKMDDALTAAIRYMYEQRWGWPLILPDAELTLEEDRLVVATVTDRGLISRLDYSRSGVLRIQEYLRYDEFVTINGIDMTQLMAEEVARIIGLFARFAGKVLCPVFSSTANLQWTLHDARHLRLVASPAWVRWPAQVEMSTKSETCTTPERDWTIDNLSDSYLASQLTSALRELLYPFVKPNEGSRSVHINPPESAVIEQFVSKLPK